MYLPNSELRKISAEIITGCDHQGHPFTDDQIRVCSIDLRVGQVFWKFVPRSRPVDLSKHSIFEISERRLWKKVLLREGESIALRPGEMLLGSTYERINMPITHVGKINTRSSYARLGLSTACNCDLVNPGYVGHVPLELTNTTKNTFLIYPYLPLCQLFVMRLDGEAVTSYDSAQYSSLYQHDDGGPSRWWRDSLAKKISAKALPEKIESATLDRLRAVFDKIDDEGIHRLEKLLEKRQFGSADDLMDEYRSSEHWKSFAYRVRRGLGTWAFPAMFALAIKHWFENGLPSFSIASVVSVDGVILFALLVSAGPLLYYVFTRKRTYYSDLDEKSQKD